jgi:two-component system KDP operon response regulator KdpE
MEGQLMICSAADPPRGETMPGEDEFSSQDRPAGRLLIIDDDYALRRTLHLTLYGMGFDINEAASSEEGLSLTQAVRYDAALVDINLPGKDGISLCRELRSKHPGLGILMLTVRGDLEDRINALDAGADDYVVKPFHMPELSARIRAVVRRMRTPREDPGDVIRIGDLTLHSSRRLLHKSGQPVHLTPKEFDLLEHLMKHPGLPASHSKLLSSVWGPEYASQVEYLRTFVRQLRKKLEDDPARPRYLLTENHVGYRFADTAPEAKPEESSGAT